MVAGSSFGLAQQPPASNLAESFTVSLGSSHSKVTHNLRLIVSDPAIVFPTHRVKSEQDDAIHAQTASSLYGQNLTGLVQLVNIQDWAKYKSGLVCHQGKYNVERPQAMPSYRDSAVHFFLTLCVD